MAGSKLIKAAIKAVLAVLAVGIGTSIILWVLYNELVERLPEYERPPFVGVFGVGPAMIAMGIYWGTQSFQLFADRRRARRKGFASDDPITPE